MAPGLAKDRRKASDAVPPHVLTCTTKAKNTKGVASEFDGKAKIRKIQSHGCRQTRCCKHIPSTPWKEGEARCHHTSQRDFCCCYCTRRCHKQQKNSSSETSSSADAAAAAAAVHSIVATQKNKLSRKTSSSAAAAHALIATKSKNNEKLGLKDYIVGSRIHEEVRTCGCSKFNEPGRMWILRRL